MAKLKTIFFCGHESRYGRAHIKPLLTSPVFSVEEVVLATIERWNHFLAALTGVPVRSTFSRCWGFAKQLRSIHSQVKSLSSARVRTVFDVNTAEERKRIEKFDVVISAAYPQIFHKDLLEQPQRAAINFHPSFLPRCRGAHPVYWTIASEEPYGGVSCHIMTERLDKGPLVAQRKLQFEPATVTYGQLYSQVEVETPILCRDVEEFFSKNQTPVPQSGEASYFRNDREIHHRIFFSTESAGRISAKIRAGKAFAYDRFGRCVEFRPPVQFATSCKFLTNSVEKHFVNGTVAHVDGCRAWIMVQGGFVETSYQVTLTGIAGRLRALSRHLSGTHWHNLRLATGEVLH